MKQTEKRFTEVCVLDICFPDYFTGYHMPVLNIATFKGMTNKDLAQSIKECINMDFEYLCDEDNKDRTFTEKEIDIFVKYANKLNRSKKQIIISDDNFSEDEEDETPYIYISLCKPIINNGMRFLNA